MAYDWLKYWVQRRTVVDGDLSYEEVVFNETQFDYFKARALRDRLHGRSDAGITSLAQLMPREKASALSERESLFLRCEDAEVWVDYLGVRFLARLFRRSTHFFQGGDSWGTELMWLLSDYFGVRFWRVDGSQTFSSPVLVAFSTSTRYVYCYDPAEVSDGTPRFVEEGSPCPVGATVRGRGVAGTAFRGAPAAVPSACLCCPMRLGERRTVDGAVLWGCRVTSFPGWKERPLEGDVDFFER